MSPGEYGSIMYPYQVWGAGHSHERIITPEAQEMVFERWELYKPRRYPDGVRTRDTAAGLKGSTIWSIGFGHAEDGDNEPKIIPAELELSLAEARKLLRLDIAPKERWVNVRIKVPLTTFMYAALTSLTYQFGQGRLDLAAKGLTINKDNEHVPLIIKGEHKSFPLADLFNEGKYVDAAVMLTYLDFKKDGSFSKGLHLRRASETGWLMTRKEL